MMKKRSCLAKISFIVLMVGSSLAYAGDYEDLVDDLSHFNALSAKFVQTVTYDNGKEGPSSQGEMKLQRPRSFYWHIMSPSEQIVVADGRYLWVYDPDLEQVVRRRQDQQDTIPALLLSGHIHDIKEAMQVKKTQNLSGGNAYAIRIEKKDGQSQIIHMTFRQKRINTMTIENELGQSNRFTFSHVSTYSQLPRSLFDFKPPKGVDVMIED